MSISVFIISVLLGFAGLVVFLHWMYAPEEPDDPYLTPNVPCEDCGHLLADHRGMEGACIQCGCSGWLPR